MIAIGPFAAYIADDEDHNFHKQGVVVIGVNDSTDPETALEYIVIRHDGITGIFAASDVTFVTHGAYGTPVRHPLFSLMIGNES